MENRENETACSISNQHHPLTVGSRHQSMCQHFCLNNVAIVTFRDMLQRAWSRNRSRNCAVWMFSKEQTGHYRQHLHAIKDTTAIIYPRCVLHLDQYEFPCHYQAML